MVQSKVIGSCKVSFGPRHSSTWGKSSIVGECTYDSKAGIVAKYLVDNHVIGSNPADPVEVGEALGDPTREPVPCKTPGKYVEEVSVSTNAPSIGDGGIGRFVIVESIHESCLGQGLGPDHGSRPDQETAHDSGHAKPDALGGEDEEHLEAPPKMLLIEDLLSQEDVGRISHASLDGYRRHHDDDGMFFHIERAGVQVPFQPKSVEFMVR